MINNPASEEPSLFLPLSQRNEMNGSSWTAADDRYDKVHRTRRRAAAAVVAAAVVLAARRAGWRPVQAGAAGRLASPAPSGILEGRSNSRSSSEQNTNNIHPYTPPEADSSSSNNLPNLPIADNRCPHSGVPDISSSRSRCSSTITQSPTVAVRSSEVVALPTDPHRMLDQEGREVALLTSLVQDLATA